MTTNSLSDPVDTQIHSKLTNSQNLKQVLMVEKFVNKTVASVNETVIVNIIMTNLRSTPVYNITLTEFEIVNPLINVTGLVSPITFQKLDSGKKITIAYTITSSKPVEITIDEAIVTYQITQNGPLFLSYSNVVSLSFIEEVITATNETDNKNYLILAILVLFYILILLIRLYYKWKQNNNASSSS